MVIESSIAFSLFGFDVRWYGLIYAIGFLCTYFYFIKCFDSKKLSDDDKDSIFFTIVITSLVFARLVSCFFYYPNYYFSNPIDVFKIWEGGMSIHGGCIGFFISLYYISKKYNISIYSLSDFFMLPALLGLAFGRIGNFLNQELYGIVTTSSVGVVFPAVDDALRYPYQLFAGFKNLIVFQIILYLHIFKTLNKSGKSNKSFKKGTITLYSIILYSLGRFFLDFIREPTTLLFTFPVGQWFSIVTVIICSILLYKLYK